MPEPVDKELYEKVKKKYMQNIHNIVHIDQDY
jgi:hypothetical protein